MENDEFYDGDDENMMDILWKYDGNMENDEFYDGNDENMMDI